MPTTAAGSISLAQECLRTTLAACASFQTLVAADDAAEALLRIYHDALPAPATDSTYTAAEWAAVRPYAIVATDQHGGLRRAHDCSSTTFGFNQSGRLWLLLAAAPDPTETAAEQDLLFKNAVGQILDDLCTKAGVAGYLSIESITLLTWGRNTHEDAAGSGEEQVAIFSIEWGS